MPIIPRHDRRTEAFQQAEADHDFRAQELELRANRVLDGRVNRTCGQRQAGAADAGEARPAADRRGCTVLIETGGHHDISVLDPGADANGV